MKKNLRNFCIVVLNDYQRRVALAFYKRATRLPVRLNNSLGTYIGIVNAHPLGGLSVKPKGVICGNMPCPNETIISFENIVELADSPSRVKALVSARRTRLTVRNTLIN